MTYLESAAKRRTNVISESIDDTFGPNPCTSLKLLNEITNELVEKPCDGKRCIHCSPRKQANMQYQLQSAFGEYAYILRVNDPAPIIERLKKQNQRHDLGWIYQSVGDADMGYILISNLPIIEHQNRTSLKDWLQRVVESWASSTRRVRRSRSIGRLSLLPIRRKRQQGTSVWKRVTMWVRDDTPWQEPLSEAVKLRIWHEKRVIERALLETKLLRHSRKEAARAIQGI